MTFYTSSPALTENIAQSIERIEANLAHLYAALGNEHSGLTTSATSVTHADIISSYRAAGIISRTVSDANGGVDENLSFTPTLVIFDYIYLNGDAVEACNGHGYYDGTDNKYHGYYFQTASPTAWYALGPGTDRCIQCRDDGDNTAAGVCSFGTNKFTLTWTKAGSGADPQGTCRIRYVAFG